MSSEMANYPIQQLRSSGSISPARARVGAFQTNGLSNKRDFDNNDKPTTTPTTTRKDLIILQKQQRATASPCPPPPPPSHPPPRSRTLIIKSALFAALCAIGCLVSFSGDNRVSSSTSNSLFVVEELTAGCSSTYPPSSYSLLKSFAHSKYKARVMHNKDDLCHHFGVFSSEEEEAEESRGQRLFFESSSGLFDLSLPSRAMMTTDNNYFNHLFFGGLVRFAEASPPLTRLELNRMSDHVFAGRIIEVERKPFVDYADPSRVESHYRLTIEVDRVLKTARNSSSHTAVYWHALPVKEKEVEKQKKGNTAVQYKYFSTEINEALYSTTNEENKRMVKVGKKKQDENGQKEIVYVIFSVIAPSERERALRSEYLSKVRQQREAMIGGSMRMGWRKKEEERKKLFNAAGDDLSEEEGEETEKVSSSSNAGSGECQMDKKDFAATGMDFFAKNPLPAFSNDILGFSTAAATATADPYVLLSEYGNTRDEDAADIPRVNETRIFFTTFFGQKRHQFTSTFPFEGLAVPYSYVAANSQKKEKETKESQSESTIIISGSTDDGENGHPRKVKVDSAVKVEQQQLHSSEDLDEAPSASSTRRRAMSVDPEEDDDDEDGSVTTTEQQTRAAAVAATAKVAPNTNAYNGVILTTKRQRETIRLAEQQAPPPANSHDGKESEVLESSLDVKKTKKGMAASSEASSLVEPNVAEKKSTANNKKPKTQTKSKPDNEEEKKEKVSDSNLPAASSSQGGRKMNATTGVEKNAEEGVIAQIVIVGEEAPEQQAKGEVTSMLHMFVDPRRPKTFLSLQPNGMMKLMAESSNNNLGGLTTTTTSTSSSSSIVDKLVEAYFMTPREIAEEEAKEREKMWSGGGGRFLGGGGRLFVDESAVAGDSFALRVTREREKKERDIRVARRWKRSQSRSKSKSRSQKISKDDHIAHDEDE